MSVERDDDKITITIPVTDEDLAILSKPDVLAYFTAECSRELARAWDEALRRTYGL